MTHLSRWHAEVQAVPPGLGEVPGPIICDAFVDADTRIEAEEKAMRLIQGAVSASAEFIDGGYFRRSGPPLPYADEENPGAAKARDAFIAARVCEILRDTGCTATSAAVQAFRELNGEE